MIAFFKNIGFKISLAYILSIFATDNNLINQNLRIAKNIQELTDRRTGESPVNTSKCKFCRLLSTHLSGNGSKSKPIKMDNNRQVQGPIEKLKEINQYFRETREIKALNQNLISLGIPALQLPKFPSI